MAADEDEYDAVFEYLRTKRYPMALKDKNSKRNFRRKVMDNYKIEDDQLHYHKKGCEDWKKVPQTQRERKRVIEACHTETGGNIIYNCCLFLSKKIVNTK